MRYSISLQRSNSLCVGTSHGELKSTQDMVSLRTSAGMSHLPSRDIVAYPLSPQVQNTSQGTAYSGYLPSPTLTQGHGAQQIHGAFLLPTTSPAVPHGNGTQPCHRIPTYEDYKQCIPEEDRWKLDRKIDFEHENIDLHLGELAEVFEKWEEIAPLLGLSSTEVGDITKDFCTQAEQRYRRVVEV